MPAISHAASLSLDAAIGQLICPTLYGAQLRNQPYDEPAVIDSLDRYGWGGFIVFHAPADVAARRISRLQDYSPIPLLIAADMEHGAGTLIEGLTAMPPAMAYGATGDVAATQALGAWTGYEARHIGVNWVFAPVADVTNNPYNPIIALRSFGGDPQAVADHVAAFVRGCQGQGVLACAKHFPGHGDTATDSHSRLGAVPADRHRLEAVEWPPFRSAIAAGVASLMTAHIAVPALDAADVPATLSPAVMTGLLRDAWGFQGIIVTDAMLMGGITTVRDAATASVEALLAGCDMLLMPRDPVATFEAVRQAVRTGRLSEARIYEAAGRILTAKAWLKDRTTRGPSGDPHAHALDVARRAVTLAKGPASWRLPDDWGVITVLDGITAEGMTPWRQSVQTVTVTPETPDAAWQTLQDQSQGWAGLLIAVASPIRVSKDRSLLTADLVARLQSLVGDKPSAVATLSSPFVVAQFPTADVWLVSHGIGADQQRALAAALKNGDYPGRMVVSLPSDLTAPDSTWKTETTIDLPPFA